MFRFGDMSIRRKLTLVILLTCTLVLIIGGTAITVMEIVTTRRAMVEDMTMLAGLLARNNAAPLAFHQDVDVEEVRKNLAALTADPDILMAAVYDRQGHVFGKYLRADQAIEVPSAPPGDMTHFANGTLEIVRPVELDAARQGTIFLRADLGQLYRKLWVSAIVISLILLAMVVLTLVISPWLHRPVSEPILALAAVARRVARDRDFTARAVKRSQDEVGALTDAFNQMLQEIDHGQVSLQKAKDAAESANRAKDHFLAVLSHELRTPLTPVLLTLSMLQERKNLPADLANDLQMVRRHVELEARLIDDLLDLTRIARGKLKLNFQTADAHVLLQDAIRICCAGREQDVKPSLDAKEHHVNADPGRFLQVFWNLLNNAQKFTPLGQSIYVHTSNPEPGRLRVEVRDRGIGIRPDALSRIFAPFEQAQQNRVAGGLGLGLTIAKALVEAHGGTINAASEGEGKGAAFVVEVETIPAPAPVVVEKPSPGPMQSEPRPLRLLVVEDHPQTLMLMTRLLRGIGHEVKSAATVSNALAIAEREPIDVVVSDLGLPDGSGLDLMRQLRDRYGLVGIALSGFGMEEDLARSAEAGFQHHLTKPIDLAQLKSALETVAEMIPG